MKKNILFLILLLSFFIGNKIIKAEESVVYSTDNMEISSDSFTTFNEKLNLIKGSNLFVKLIAQDGVDYEVVEPELNIEVFDVQNNTVWSASSPKTKAPNPQKQPDEFDKYLEKNKNFFKAVSFTKNVLNIKVPLNINGGEYRLKITSTNYPKISVDYKFILSNSAYNFTDTQILVEDLDVYANIGYESKLEKEENNKVVISVSQYEKEIFKKEIDKTFYKEGTINVNERVEVLKNMVGEVLVKVDILDKDGSIILTKTKTVNITHVNSNKIYYMILSVLILLLIIVFMVFKKKKQKSLMMLMILLMSSVAFVGAHSVKALTDVEVCGTKPTNECIEDSATNEWFVKKWACNRFLRDACTVEDVRAKKYFSSGEVVDITAPGTGSTGGPISASINICSTIAGTIDNGSPFYVISDSGRSGWTYKRFHIYRFVKNESKTITFDPGGRKRNVNYATYNGGCNVTVYTKYQGDDTDYDRVYLKIVEAGKMSSDVCRSVATTRDVFESNVDSILDRSFCTDGELRNTFIAGSKVFSPLYNIDGTDRAAWHDKSINICKYLGYTSDTRPSITENKRFYVVAEQLGSWKMIRYPIFRFMFGQPDNRIYGDISGLTPEYASKNLYRYGGKKENVPGMKYDGNCTITFRLDNRGDDTKSWTSTYKIIEAGLTDEATCYDPELVKPTTVSNNSDWSVYKLDGEGISPYQIEFQSKIDSDGYDSTYTPTAARYNIPSGSDGGKYRNIAPFFKNLMDAGKTCKPIGTCSDPTGDWMGYFDGTTCTPPTVTKTNSCVGRDMVYKENGVQVNKVTNDPACAFNAYCVMSSSDTNLTYTFTPDRKTTLGNVEYRKDGTLVATTNKDGSYVYTKALPTTSDSMTVELKDLYDGKIVSKTCSYTPTTVTGCQPGDTSPQCNNTVVNPPVINLSKDPKVSLNKNGNCTISWDISNIPSGSSCNLSGWNINIGGGDSTVYPITLTDGASGGSKTVSGLTTNQKYTLKCSGTNLVPSPITTSIICRVNPDVKEK